MLIEVGKVVGVWGVKGWIKLHSYTRERSDIGRYSPWSLAPRQIAGDKHQADAFDVTQCRAQGRGMVAKLSGIDTREAAESLNGRIIYIERSQLPALPEGEFYWQDLIGLEVLNSAGQSFGRVKSMLETGANDVVVVTPPAEQSGPDVLIPYVDEVILEIDLEQGKMRVDWDPSYLTD